MPPIPPPPRPRRPNPGLVHRDLLQQCEACGAIGTAYRRGGEVVLQGLLVTSNLNDLIEERNAAIRKAEESDATAEDAAQAKRLEYAVRDARRNAERDPAGDPLLHKGCGGSIRTVDHLT